MRFRPLPSSNPAEASNSVIPDPPATMRAAVIDDTGDADVLHEGTLPTPSPVLSELLVRVVAAGVNPIDVKTRAGRGLSRAIDGYPVALGYDFSGVVVRAPYEAHPLQPGTPVFGMLPFPRTGGSYAEYAVVPSLSVARKPAALSYVEAAGVPLAALTAWGLVVETAHAHEGQRMLIHAGSGGVGHFAVQFAAYFGAHVTVTSSGRNAAWLRELGASVVIDYTTTEFDEVVSEVDVVIDLIGNVDGGDVGTRSMTVVRPGGLYVSVPTASSFDYTAASEQAGVRATGFVVNPSGETLATIARLLDSNSVQVYVDDVFDLADAAKAHAALEQGHTRGKIVLRVSPD